ncbi:MAG: isoleucine--tRNA ligase [Paludibacteraceae bacterium]|nr:isoleucine--tRNA ligase [Paludibacteraceae bacterium]MBN2787611.1 isoleucine--tRNA ligase [Paludibacteraceae bacterium]
MSKKFTEYQGLNLSDINKEMLQKWDEQDVFHKSIQLREGAPSFVFYEGPPSANGMPGIHHVIARSIKDIFCRYKTMKGFQVNRKAGWDTHGLPVELGVEKALGITKEDIGKKISVEEYNAACRKDVMKYTKEWEDLTRKMGYWVDMNEPYITYDNKYIETLWWLLKQLYNKNLLYKGYTIQPYSPAAGTGLSSHELNQPGCYRDVKDTTCVAQFKLKNSAIQKLNIPTWGETYFLAWTTTPWTLPSNTALCVGPFIDYVVIKTYNPYTSQKQTVIMAKALVSTLFSEKANGLSLDEYKAGDKVIPYSVVATCKGKELEGLQYEQLIPWMNPGDNAFRVITGDFVTTEDGTGIVHIAPTFGADDDRVAKAHGVPPLMLTDKDGNRRPMVDMTGKFYKLEELDADFVRANVTVDLYKEYAGRYVKNAFDTSLKENDTTLDVDICVMLKQNNQVFKIEKHTHNYPHCWRTDKPVLYYPLDSWFIRSTAVRDKMMELNTTINWKPSSTGTGRFGKWLENLNDWNLSRSRYWGTPLPIWRTEDGSEEICIGSIEELMTEIDKAVKAGFMKENPYKNFTAGNYSTDNYATKNIDLHRPYVDKIVLVSAKGQPMKRELDLIDVWFDSGAMPYAQLHYPFENASALDLGGLFPADFISEGVDQTRGWFFTLHAISTMIRESVAFKSVISTGLVLDKNGNKMSKRLGNAVDPFSTIEKYGSDPLRWYMITNASPWDNLKFDSEGIEEVRRKFFGTLYNTYSFFALYANVDKFDFFQPEVPVAQRPEIDRWIISLLHSLINEVDEAYNDYEPTRAGRAISDFVNDNLSNWYVRLNRKRFWGGEMDTDKLAAYQTLYTCLETIAMLMAPIAPFYADKLFLDLNKVTAKNTTESVHLVLFPKVDKALIDKALEERMQLAQDISSMTLALRKKVNIKVRQPLQTIMIPVLDATQQTHIEKVKEIILSEVNVKAINFVDDSSGILVKRMKPDFKKLGAKCGKNMKQVAAQIQAFTQQDIAAFEKNGQYNFTIEGQNIEIVIDDVEVISEDIPGWLVTNNGNLTVALDITITDELEKEGLARELINRIQNLRKSSGFEITDRIAVQVQKSPEMDGVIASFGKYIAAQVLAGEIVLSDSLSKPTALDFDDFVVNVCVNKL